MGKDRLYSAVTIGVSSGGIAALEKILPALDRDFSMSVCIVQHLSPQSENYLPVHFATRCRIKVKEAEDKEIAELGVVYFAPPNYHLMLETERTLALSVEERVNFSRPSIDVLFETAAEAYGDELIGIILTGANADGARGLATIKNNGGLAIVQSPESAEAPTMVEAALRATTVDHVLELEEIGPLLNSLSQSTIFHDNKGKDTYR